MKSPWIPLCGITTNSNHNVDPGCRLDDGKGWGIATEVSPVKREKSMDPRPRGDDEQKQELAPFAGMTSKGKS